jgi:hypothetical protein
MLWYLALTGSLFYAASREQVPAANVALSCVVAALLVVMIVLALPKLRARFHDRFEVTHRFCGLGALVGGWLNTVVLAASHRGRPSMAGALLATPTLWILLLSTASGMISWVRLRKVPITVERPSSHAAIVSFDHGLTPLVGSARAISHNPLSGWHYFANVPAPAASRSGYRMVVSRAGDWTGEFIDNPPSHVWIRGIPTAGMANVRKLFTRVVYVATGSGIGPMLAHLLVNEVPARPSGTPTCWENPTCWGSPTPRTPPPGPRPSSASRTSGLPGRSSTVLSASEFPPSDRSGTHSARGAQVLDRHAAATSYSWISPPSRSRRRGALG